MVNCDVVMVNLDRQFVGMESHHGDRLFGMTMGELLDGAHGRLSLSVDGTIPSSGVLDRTERRKGA